MFKHVSRWIASRTVRVALVGAAVSALPAVSMAADLHRGDRDDHDRARIEPRYDRRDTRGSHDSRDYLQSRDFHDARDYHDSRDARDFRRDDCPDFRPQPVAPARLWVEPVYRTVTENTWIPPVYRTVTDHVWHEPVVQKVSERVWVPDKYETRPANPPGGAIALRKVLVKPGHYEDVCHDVVVRAGYYEDVCRQELVCDGHYETVTHEELVSVGHWEDCGPVADNHRGSGVDIDVRLPF